MLRIPIKDIAQKKIRRRESEENGINLRFIHQ